MNHIPEPTATDDLFVFGQAYEDGQRHVIVSGLESDTHGGLTSPQICLTADDAFALGQRLIFWSGKVPTVQKRQEASEYIHAIADRVRMILENSTRVTLSDDAHALSQDVLSLLSATWESGVPLPTKNAFGRALRLLGHEPWKSNGERYYLGVHLAPEVNAPSGE